VKDGHTYGAIIILKGFTMALINRSMATAFTASDQDIDLSTIRYHGDLSGNSQQFTKN